VDERSPSCFIIHVHPSTSGQPGKGGQPQGFYKRGLPWPRLRLSPPSGGVSSLPAAEPQSHRHDSAARISHFLLRFPTSSRSSGLEISAIFGEFSSEVGVVLGVGTDWRCRSSIAVAAGGCFLACVIQNLIDCLEFIEGLASCGCSRSRDYRGARFLRLFEVV
jgi:hypothetical protein